IGFVLTALSYLLFRRFIRPAASPEPTSATGAIGVLGPAAYETADADVGRVVTWGIGLVVGTLVLLVAVTILFLGFVGRPFAVQIPPPGLAISQNPPGPLPPEPRLEAAPGVSAEFVRSREDPILHGYGWVDQKNGVVRIPIERAIDLLSQRGLPSLPTPSPNQQPRDQGQSVPSYPRDRKSVV